MKIDTSGALSPTTKSVEDELKDRVVGYRKRRAERQQKKELRALAAIMIAKKNPGMKPKEVRQQAARMMKKKRW